jgi:hypothetical protein
MASESKIKVKNPVVELDGDEVRKLCPLYSPELFTPGRITNSASWCIFVSTVIERGEKRGSHALSCANPLRVGILRNAITSLDHSLTGDFRGFIDDPYYLERNQGKG